MKIGTLFIEVYAELLQKDSIDLLQNSLYNSFSSVSSDFFFDYRRFSYFATTLIWEIPLHSFWKNQFIYDILKRNLNKYFINWELEMYLTIKETG